MYPAQEDGEYNSNGHVDQQKREVEVAAVGKSTLFVKLEWPAGPRNIIGTRITSKNGRQATVRGEMRSKQIDGEEYQEPNAKSDREAFCHPGLPTILKD